MPPDAGLKKPLCLDMTQRIDVQAWMTNWFIANRRKRNEVRRSQSWIGFWKASVTLCNVCAESLNLTGCSLVKKVLMLLVREENGLFGSLGTWPLSVQILNSLRVLTRFYLQRFQLSPRKYCWEQGREETEAWTELEKGGEEGIASSCFVQQVS